MDESMTPGMNSPAPAAAGPIAATRAVAATARKCLVCRSMERMSCPFGLSCVISVAGRLPEDVVGRMQDSATWPTVPALQVSGEGASPPVVSMRWMYFVPTSRSPSAPAFSDVTRSRSHGIAVGSTVIEPLPSSAAVILLPSRACQLGPPKWVASSFQVSSYRFARGPTEPPAVAAVDQGAGVDLDADRVPDEERLVSVGYDDRAGYGGSSGPAFAAAGSATARTTRIAGTRRRVRMDRVM